MNRRAWSDLVNAVDSFVYSPAGEILFGAIVIGLVLFALSVGA